MFSSTGDNSILFFSWLQRFFLHCSWTYEMRISCQGQYRLSCCIEMCYCISSDVTLRVDVFGPAGIGIRTEMNEAEGSSYSHDIIKFSTNIHPPFGFNGSQ